MTSLKIKHKNYCLDGYYQEEQCYKSTALSPTPGAWALPCHIRKRRSSSAGYGTSRLLAVSRDWLLELRRVCVLGCRGIPVVYDLQEQNEVQHEACDKAVQNERVVDFLKRSEDAREGAEKVVDHLYDSISMLSSLWMRHTYSERAQLACSTLLPDGQNLRHLASHTQHTSCRLQKTEPLGTNPLLVEQRASSGDQATNPAGNAQTVSAVLQDQTRNRDVLDQDECRLAIRAERKSIAHVVRQRDEVCAGLEQVRRKRETLCGLRVDKFEQLGYFDNGRCADDADSEALGDGELKALGVGGVDVEEQRLVACWRDERLAQVLNRLRQVVRDGLQDGAESVHGSDDGDVCDDGICERVVCGNFWLRALT